MNRKIDAENQAEDTEGHEAASSHRTKVREDKPEDTEGHRAAKRPRSIA